jgi:HSP20 family protein
MLQLFRNNPAFAPVANGSINRLDALFNSLAGDDGGFLSQPWSRTPVAMWQDEDNLHIEVEMPGVAEQDVDVTVHQGTVYIRAERKPEQGREYLYNGRWFGQFERAITLPDAVNTSDVEATLANGVLSLNFRKAAEAKPKKITLKKGD